MLRRCATVTLDAFAADATDNVYRGWYIAITSGAGVAQARDPARGVARGTRAKADLGAMPARYARAARGYCWHGSVPACCVGLIRIADIAL